MENIPQSHESEDKKPESTGIEFDPERPILEQIGRWARRAAEERFATQVRNMANNVDRARQEREENNQE